MKTIVLIIFTLNLGLAIASKDFHAIAGWFCAVITTASDSQPIKLNKFRSL